MCLFSPQSRPFIRRTKQPCHRLRWESSYYMLSQSAQLSIRAFKILLHKNHQVTLVTAESCRPISLRPPKRREVPKTTINTDETNLGTTPTSTTGPSAHGMKQPATPSLVDDSLKNHPSPPSFPNIVKSTSVRSGLSSHAVSIKLKLRAN